MSDAWGEYWIKVLGLFEGDTVHFEFVRRDRHRIWGPASGLDTALSLKSGGPVVKVRGESARVCTWVELRALEATRLRCRGR